MSKEIELQNGKMTNFSAANTGRIIPYNPLYREFGKSVTGAILFQQLEYWFAKMGKPFYKFAEPPKNNSYYEEGQSWTEELGFSSEEFRTAFDNLGIRYSSRTEYETAVIMSIESGGRLDVFAGKLYCSYHDKIKGLTFYYRNHSKTDALLSRFTETNNTDSRKPTIPSYASQPPQVTCTDKPDSEYKQESTQKIKQDTTQYIKKAEAETHTGSDILSSDKETKVSLPKKQDMPLNANYSPSEEILNGTPSQYTPEHSEAPQKPNSYYVETYVKRYKAEHDEESPYQLDLLALDDLWRQLSHSEEKFDRLVRNYRLDKFWKDKKITVQFLLKYKSIAADWNREPAPVQTKTAYNTRDYNSPEHRAAVENIRKAAENRQNGVAVPFKKKTIKEIMDERKAKEAQEKIYAKA